MVRLLLLLVVLITLSSGPTPGPGVRVDCFVFPAQDGESIAGAARRVVRRGERGLQQEWEWRFERLVVHHVEEYAPSGRRLVWREVGAAGAAGRTLMIEDHAGARHSVEAVAELERSGSTRPDPPGFAAPEPLRVTRWGGGDAGHSLLRPLSRAWFPLELLARGSEPLRTSDCSPYVELVAPMARGLEAVEVSVAHGPGLLSVESWRRRDGSVRARWMWFGPVLLALQLQDGGTWALRCPRDLWRRARARLAVGPR